MPEKKTVAHVEECQLLVNGKIRFNLETGTVTLRRPQVLQYAQILDWVNDIDTQRDKNVADGDTLFMASSKAYSEFWRRVVTSLNEEGLMIDSVDHYPNFIVGLPFLQVALQHWQSSPLVLGNKQKEA